MRRRVVAQGRVQGVSFRDSVRRRASSAGVAGWVHNRPDGAVEAVLEGDADAVDALVDYFGRGPPGAAVEHVDVADEEPQGLSGFELR